MRIRIKKVSRKRAAQLRKYSKLRREHLEKFPFCATGCGNQATEIHHMAGRENERLLETEYFLSVCTPCHTKITREPGWAFERGYSVSRLTAK